MLTIMGVDLAGVEKNPTGICILRDFEVETKHLYTDEEILHEAEEVRCDLVAIDAPLSIPRGRKSLDERSNVHLRECDKELLKRRIKFFPVTLGPMRILTKRGMKLKEKLTRRGFKVIEVFPGGAQDVLGIARKTKGKNKLLVGLKKLGLKGLRKEMSDHELDAVTAALVGRFYMEGKYEAFGDPEEGLIIMPEAQVSRKWRH